MPWPRMKWRAWPTDRPVREMPREGATDGMMRQCLTQDTTQRRMPHPAGPAGPAFGRGWPETSVYGAEGTWRVRPAMEGPAGDGGSDRRWTVN